MKSYHVNGQQYRLPSEVSDFQLEMYVHLVNWKWKHITREPGLNAGIEYDTFLPESVQQDWPLIYQELKDALIMHLEKFPFRIHRFFNHVASSQAANINLFMPVLLHPRVNEIFGKLKPDFKTLATEQFDKGFRIEFWDGKAGSVERGLLGDHTQKAGTDTDIAIAYHNHHGELCLWLIEHKLTEKEFTDCGGFKSPRRTTEHACWKSFDKILSNKHLCYYHDVKGYNYWRITETNQALFANHTQHQQCPFQGGMNQLWRNQLLALSIEQDERQPFKHVFFSVVRHPRNDALDNSIVAYKKLIDNNPKFSTFTSADVINAAANCNDVHLNAWILWYKDLYKI